MKMLINKKQIFSVLALCLTILSVGYQFDLRQKRDALKQAQATEMLLCSQLAQEKQWLTQFGALKNQLQVSKKIILPYVRFDNETKIMADVYPMILQLAEQNGLSVRDFPPPIWSVMSKVKVFTLHLVAVGSFAQFAGFIAQLAEDSLPIALTDFSLQLEKNNELRMELDLMGFYVPTKNPENTLMLQSRRGFKFQLPKWERDPFVMPVINKIELNNQVGTEPELLQAVSLRQIKLVGYVHERDHCWVLGQAPSGKTAEIYPGEKLGIEQLPVLSVSEQGVVVESAGKKIHLAQGL